MPHIFTSCSHRFAGFRSAIPKWTSIASNNQFYAVTVNDSGNVLGQFCYPAEGNCTYLLGIKTGCQEGNKYTTLANSDKGAFLLEIVCKGELRSGMHSYGFSSFDTIDDLVRSSLQVGFAVPLESDNFRIIRFDLKGSTAAIKTMRQAAEASTSAPSPRSPKSEPARRSTRDQTM